MSWIRLTVWATGQNACLSSGTGQCGQGIPTAHLGAGKSRASWIAGKIERGAAATEADNVCDYVKLGDANANMNPNLGGFMFFGSQHKNLVAPSSGMTTA